VRQEAHVLRRLRPRFRIALQRVLGCCTRDALDENPGEVEGVGRAESNSLPFDELEQNLPKDAVFADEAVDVVPEPKPLLPVLAGPRRRAEGLGALFLLQSGGHLLDELAHRIPEVRGGKSGRGALVA
jgi:hypothetical protein